MTSWKAIPGYEGLYEVSDGGVVKSLGRAKRYTNYVAYSKERFLKPSDNGRGYLHCVLYDSLGKPKTYKVHTLVALTWLDKTYLEYKYQVNHKDGNKLNNNLSNLELVTNKENIVHFYNRKYLLEKDNVCYETNNLYEFCKQRGITYSNMFKVLRGNRNHVNGWKVRVI